MGSKARITGTLAAIAAVFLVAPPASGQLKWAPDAQKDSLSCELAGVMGLANPGAPSLLTDRADGTLGDVDYTTYILSADAVCARADSEPGEELNSGSYRVQIRSFGTYNSRECGVEGQLFDDEPSDTSFTPVLSGSAVGTAGLQAPIAPTYDLFVYGTHGFLHVTGGSWDGGSLAGSGNLDLVPLDADSDPATIPCVNEDARLLQVSGSISLEAL